MYVSNPNKWFWVVSYTYRKKIWNFSTMDMPDANVVNVYLVLANYNSAHLLSPA